ncbi:TetR/AcrR family transcriptional regulator [Aurantiacibacter suaedae]|uniref:TetR/AcrR family transcriptional regulator n=1 Tax=Aurantiacibacter suaedae TaxID=2545755 RepID=UPI0010F93300|nr:TetR/AcrR family transcriptional regulator [Aurantiacibacter suaedae]
MELDPPVDARALKSRSAILAAFTRLAFEKRLEAIRIADIVAEAGVGRATFYDHYQGKEAVMLAALEPMLVALGSVASGRAALSYIEGMTAHCWERRVLFRALLDSSAARAIQRQLGEIIRARLAAMGLEGSASALQATGLAAAQLAMLRSWVGGEAQCTPEDMAARLIECARMLPDTRP